MPGLLNNETNESCATLLFVRITDGWGRDVHVYLPQFDSGKRLPEKLPVELSESEINGKYSIYEVHAENGEDGWELVGYRMVKSGLAQPVSSERRLYKMFGVYKVSGFAHNGISITNNGTVERLNFKGVVNESFN